MKINLSQNIRTSFELVAVVSAVSSVFTVCAAAYVYVAVIKGNNSTTLICIECQREREREQSSKLLFKRHDFRHYHKQDEGGLG